MTATPWPPGGPEPFGVVDPQAIPLRRRVLVIVALLGCLAVLMLARWLAESPMIDLRWDARPDGTLVLREPLAAQAAPTGSPPLPPSRVVAGISVGGGPVMRVDDALLQRSPRWQIDSARRTALIAQHESLAAMLAAAQASSTSMVLHLQGGAELSIPSWRRGFARLGLAFWPLAGLALLLYLSSMVVLLTRPGLPGALFLLISLCQAGSLLFIALQSMPGFGMPPGLTRLELPFRSVFDLLTGAAALQVLSLHPRKLARRRAIAGAGWSGAVAVLLCVGFAQRGSPAAANAVWWALQGGCIALGAATLATVEHAFHIDRDARTRVLRRFAGAALSTLVLVSLAVSLAQSRPGFGATVAADVAVGASIAWTLFIASLLLLMPFLTRGQPLLRELALLAGVSTVATSFDLLFVAVFSLGSFASLALAVFLALALYAGARQWALDRLLGARVLSAERVFDHIYRAARALQARPERYPAVLVQLLRELYEPLEVLRSEAVPPQSCVMQGGAALVVPQRPPAGGPAQAGLLLRSARRGQRLFTIEDARLADRVLEHLRRAVAYDQAVERGRSEERMRIAQDLHDDIGARLLTLMYQSPTREMEDYLRHTLQDLKTLTRGLATAEHRLSHAGVEWKADLAQRLTAAGSTLSWNLECDRDLLLTMAQWSALTRVLRELVSNALYHGRAAHVSVGMSLRSDALTLEVADNGAGRAPASWAPGLGLGGVRKRVRALNGEVVWQERQPCGIVCRARFTGFGIDERAGVTPT